MESLTRFVARANNLNGGAHWTNTFAHQTKVMTENIWHTLNNPDAQKWFLFTLCIPGALFILLSPGLIVNIPVVSKNICSRLVPLPDGATGNCNSAQYVSGTNDILTNLQGSPICIQRRACNRFGASEYTSVDSIVFHGFIFVVLLIIVRTVLKAGGLAPLKGHV